LLELSRSFLLLVCSIVPSSAQTFDVLIVESSKDLTVYDAFQKSVSEDLVERMLPSFAPVKVLDARHTLNDGLTRCMKVEFGGVPFYFLTGDNDTPSLKRPKAVVRRFSRKSFYNDTVSIVVGRQITFWDPLKRTSRHVRDGEHFVRYFSEQGQTYAGWISENPEYGWLTLISAQEGKTWRRLKSGVQASALSRATVERIVERLRQANRTLAEIHGALSRQSGKSFPKPHWTVESRKESIICALEPVELASSYHASVEAMAAALQTYLIGSGYDAIPFGNKIEIRKR